MLEIHVVETELWDRQAERFIEKDWGTLQLEHSLISISKWESKWHISFLETKSKSAEQMLDYIRCMSITSTKNNPEIFNHLTKENIIDIQNYINDAATATTFSENTNEKHGGKRQRITAEVIYYWMIANNIPFECQKWHLNRLLALIRVCSIKNNPKKKKVPKADTATRYAALNTARKAKYNTRG